MNQRVEALRTRCTNGFETRAQSMTDIIGRQYIRPNGESLVLDHKCRSWPRLPLCNSVSFDQIGGPTSPRTGAPGWTGQK